jgi:hypothetical protein
VLLLVCGWLFRRTLAPGSGGQGTKGPGEFAEADLAVIGAKETPGGAA